MKKVHFFVFAFISSLALSIVTLNAGSGIQFMSPDFAKMMCSSWNESSLPGKLGSKEKGGNDWINTENKYTGEKRGRQVLIMSRRDCPGIPRVQLTIENRDGLAVCSYGGAITESYEKAEWAFAPETEQWYKFASGKWGYMQMPGIMSGFRGPMFVARANIDNFGIFWKIAGSVAKRTNADYRGGCSSLKDDTAKDIEDYLSKIY